ncbi:MAG: multiubiquitin domain-containing protein [Gemmatimonadaceae bacterium]|nr:multiubiquitin domain-containing protein [Gemmatimonadaceae bacterium]
MSDKETKQNGHATIHIFVNRRKFGVDEGVKEVMTGAEIAGLVGVPAANAVIRVDTGPDKREIAATEQVALKQGDHFLVTRHTVEGGSPALMVRARDARGTAHRQGQTYVGR